MHLAQGSCLSDALEQRLQGTALVFVLLCSLKNKDCIFLLLDEAALNCMRLCRSKMLPNLTLMCLGFFNSGFFVAL